jgi:pilus assembly protein CpaD
MAIRLHRFHGAARVILLAGVLALPLGACMGGKDENRSLESIHQPVVQRNSFVFDVSTLPGGGLAVSEQRRLVGWLEAVDVRYGDRLSLDDPAESDQTRSAVEGAAGRFGILLADTAPVTAGEVAPGTARVVLMRTVASVPGCPDWSGKIDQKLENTTSPGYGCAINSNMAAMVANKEDLVRGQRGTGTTILLSNNKAIQAFRAKPATGAGELKQVSSKSGSN